MRRSLVPAFVVISILSLAACSRTRPILEITDHPIPPQAQRLPLATISKDIEIAGGRRGWQFVEIAPGHLQATYAPRGEKFQAVVDIMYSQAAFSIHLNHSSGLDQTATEIHHNYNRWVNQLEVDIAKELSTAG